MGTTVWGGKDIYLLSSILLGMAFYGLEAMSRKISNPIGWDPEGEREGKEKGWRQRGG